MSSEQQNKQINISIKSMIMKPCKFIETTTLSVDSYQQVIDLWLNYKNNKIKIDNYIIRKAFDFHFNKFDHIILYHSFNLDSTLLMCKIGEKYKNIIMSNDEINNINVFKNNKPNVIATYF